MAGKMSQQKLLALQAERARIQGELSKAQGVVDMLTGELRATDRALAIFDGQDISPVENLAKPTPERRAGRGTVKDVVLGLVGEHAETGVKTTDIVSFAQARGVELDRNSVASLLSRLTREGVLVYDQDTRRYRPAPRTVTPLRSVS